MIVAAVENEHVAKSVFFHVLGYAFKKPFRVSLIGTDFCSDIPTGKFFH